MNRRIRGRDRPPDRVSGPLFIHKPICTICGHPFRAGRYNEHKDCQREIERRESLEDQKRCQRS